MSIEITRRQALALSASAMAAASAPPPGVDRAAVDRNDATVTRLLNLQITDPNSPFRGSYPDAVGLHGPGSASAILESFTAAFICPQSRFARDSQLLDRMRLAAGFLERVQTPDGNISLLTTNFNSPPDTAFVVHNVGTAAQLARLYDAPGILELVRPFLLKAGQGLAVGGVHTPNHRWVVSAALSQINAVFPDPRYVRRIDQWLAEGIDIDPDGQYNERSVLTYNIVTNRALIILSDKLKRPELLEPVRKNLKSMLYLVHADGELVSEISRRQDLNTRGDMRGYWFALQYMALKDGDGQFSALARRFTPQYASLSALLEYPQLNAALPVPAPLPEDYEKILPSVGIARIRRGETSASILLNGTSRFFTLRRGDAVVNAVRFATAFFGKGQFVPQKWSKNGSEYLLTQQLEGPYYQPLDRKVGADEWGEVRRLRKQTEICRLQQSAAIAETPDGFRLRLRAEGTEGVPLSVEINLRDGGRLTGCEEIASGVSLLRERASYTLGRNTIRFGPGSALHRYTEVRGSEPKLAGPAVYLTGFTPFDHTLEFVLG